MLSLKHVLLALPQRCLLENWTKIYSDVLTVQTTEFLSITSDFCFISIITVDYIYPYCISIQYRISNSNRSLSSFLVIYINKQECSNFARIFKINNTTLIGKRNRELFEQAQQDYLIIE